MSNKKISNEKFSEKMSSSSNLKETFAEGDTSMRDDDCSSDIQNRVLEMIKKFPKGITDTEISIEIPDLLPAERVSIFNSLLAKGCLDLYNQGGTLLYKYKEPAKSQNIKGADNEEKVVYSIIEAASNKGIWIRDIRYQSNLLPNQLNKILKALENKKLIKAVKSVSASKKKVYMLYNLEPDKSLTGGAWYSDQDFEAEFVSILSQQCYRYLQEKQMKVKEMNVSPKEARNLSYATSKDVWKFISELGISKVCLSVEDIETILDTIVYDGKVEKSMVIDTKRYRAIEPLLPSPGFVRMPCGICPVFHLCSDIGSVTPTKCEYLNEWVKSNRV